MNTRTISLLATLAFASACGGDNSPSPSPTPSSSATLRVLNASSTTVYYLYVSPCSSSGWGTDQLGSEVIPSGGGFTVHSIPGGCYDVRAEAQGRVRMAERRGVTLSAGTVSTWTIGG